MAAILSWPQSVKGDEGIGVQINSVFWGTNIRFIDIPQVWIQEHQLIWNKMMFRNQGILAYCSYHDNYLVISDTNLPT